MTNDQLELDVAAELFRDPRVGSAAIAVSADGGVVTLRGTVGSLREKREAMKAAERIYGVAAVTDELLVRIQDEDQREDTELRGDVLHALILDGLIPTTVDARVTCGFVTLTGTASWQYQRDEAKFIVANVPGVFGIEDRIKLITAPDGRDIKNDISGAFARSARLDAERAVCLGLPRVGDPVRGGALLRRARLRHHGRLGRLPASPRSTTTSRSSTKGRRTPRRRCGG